MKPTEIELGKASAAAIVALLECQYNAERAQNPGAYRTTPEARALIRRIDAARGLLTYFESL